MSYKDTPNGRAAFNTGSRKRRSTAPQRRQRLRLAVRVDTRTVRQSPACSRTWPVDWDYCNQCVTQLHGTERIERIAWLVPVSRCARHDAHSGVPGAATAAVLVACQLKCASDLPSRPEVRLGLKILRSFLSVVSAHAGCGHLIPDVGVLGWWPADEVGIDRAVRAAGAVLQTNPLRAFCGVSYGIGIAMSGGGLVSGSAEVVLRDPTALSVHLASLAAPQRVLVAEEVYRHAVERFDFRGVGIIVPRAEPLLGPTFELLGPKAERSGTTPSPASGTARSSTRWSIRSPASALRSP
jgi:hypothetical protein